MVWSRRFARRPPAGPVRNRRHQPDPTHRRVNTVSTYETRSHGVKDRGRGRRDGDVLQPAEPELSHGAGDRAGGDSGERGGRRGRRRRGRGGDGGGVRAIQAAADSELAEGTNIAGETFHPSTANTYRRSGLKVTMSLEISDDHGKRLFHRLYSRVHDDLRVQRLLIWCGDPSELLQFT